jgi:polyketide synthase PksN
VLHPLLHRNTSDLSGQRYTSTFTGDEFFLADHQVSTNGRGKDKVLPGVAYLEMVRAAVEQASPGRPDRTVLELRNMLWAQPIFVNGSRQVDIGLGPGQHDDIEYEIYSETVDEDVVHCRGSAIWSRESVPAKVDLELLKQQMRMGRLEPSTIYALFLEMGLCYGPAHQGISALYLGEKQLLAELRLPRSVERTHSSYVLHPSLLDSALQAVIGLVLDRPDVRHRAMVPFALDSLRIRSVCAQQTMSWIRYSESAMSDSLKVDIDLCDTAGNINVEMRGFVLRAWNRHSAQTTVLCHPSGKTSRANGNGSEHYSRLIQSVIDHEMSVDEATRLAMGD